MDESAVVDANAVRGLPVPLGHVARMRLPLRVRAYVAGVCALAAVALLSLVLVTGDVGVHEAWLIAAFGGVIALQHLFETRLVRGPEEGESVLHEESVLVAMALLASPLAVVIAFGAGFAAGNLVHRRERVKALFNVANAVAAVSVSLLVVYAIGGTGAASVRSALGVVAGAAVYFTLNNATVSGVLAVAGAGRFRAIFVDDLRGGALVWLGSISIGLMTGIAAATHAWALTFGLAAMLALQFVLSGHTRARSERQKLADIVGSSSDGIFSVDRDDLVISWNPAMERITGRHDVEVLGRSLDEALEVIETEPERAGAAAGAALVAPGDEPTVLRTRSAAGDERWLAVTRSQLPERGWVFVARDFTESKRAEEALAAHEEQLRHAQKMEAIGRLAGGIAHDFNNLLTTIRGYAHLLIGSYAPEERWHASVVEIEKAAARATLLTRQLLAYSRKQMLQQTAVDLNTVVLDMDGMLRRMISEDVRLITLLGDDLGRVVADRTQLEQVIMNLCLNGRDAMPLGGTLTIETRKVDVGRDPVVPPGSYVVLSVSDTGSGIDPETQKHIFEPFYTTKEQGEGTGLGLSTVYGIVAQSGGTITVESERHQGATFTIYLPRVERPAEEPPSVDRVPAAGGSETILVTEDEEGVRELIRTVLESGGYEVLAAASAREALALAEERTAPIDLLVTDVVMPEMSGVELARRLKAVRPAIAVLYVSGYTEDDIIRRGVHTASVTFLGKPFTPEDLTSKVREVLDAVQPDQPIAPQPTVP